MGFLYGIVGVMVIIALAVYLFIEREGDAVIEVRANQHEPFVVEELTQDHMTFSTRIEVANVGKQCGTIMDCYVRHLLPYEQFDQVQVISKAELDNKPRDDDYFEAVLIQRRSSIHVLVKITLVARAGGDIKAALANMVDLPVDLIYQYVTRKPWMIGKQRIVITAEEIAKLADITLADK